MEISVFLYVTAPGASESLLGGIGSRKEGTHGVGRTAGQ